MTDFLRPGHLSRRLPLAALSLALAGLLSACASTATMPPNTPAAISDETRMMYAEVQDGDITIPAIEDKYLTEEKKRQVVDYYTSERPGTIIVDPAARWLYQVQENNKAMRYSVAVGAEGLAFSGNANIAVKREWPRWTPTANMIRRDPETYKPVASGLPGGLENPLGARALYLYKGGRDTLYRIHGTPSPWTVGHATSSGCIRMFNQDSLYLYDTTPKGTKVVVLPKDRSGEGTLTPAAVTEPTTDGSA
ncbi:L,D-transpeptidase [Salipiger mangrovisoli]|uniref:L,D-transpeptidase n=1 Tax=Salipiger mangrovisoli TaxID=2865933 RepID=A0ABR9WWD5_9RHOB|nr:L,D-transpeptidase [Salipiger mangrovisoli]MBE9635604.1 L,D-transpeptidase [Salipiger mangrovisoli]